MIKQKTLKIISIVFYFFIILQGQIIGLPFFFWLLFTFFDFGNVDQVFALFALWGFIINYLNRNSSKTLKVVLLEVLSFFLLSSPIIRRMFAVPIEKFNYLAFIVPTVVFIIFYLMSICLSFRMYQKGKSN